MDQPQTNSTLDSIKPADIKVEQIRLIFSSIPASLLAILINSSILSVVLWDRIEQHNIIVWFLATNCLSIIRWQIYRRFRRTDETRHSDEIWYQLVVITTALSGATWGAAGIWLFSHQSVVHQVFLVFVIGGMCAGGITTLAAILNAGRTFVILASVPVIVQFMLINNEIGNTMTIMSVLFMGMILASASRLNKTILGTIVESLNSRHQQALSEQQMRYQANHDELTRLPNRRLLLETLTEENDRAVQTDQVGAVFFVDIDRFKAISYSLGRIVGEELLVQVANRLRTRLSPADTAAHPGGSEFVVILPEISSNLKLASEPVTNIADEFHKLLEAPYQIHGHDFHITTSIGITLFPFNQMSADDLIQYAEIAMYAARKDVKTDVRLFSQDMQDSVNQRRVIEKELQLAIENSEFELYFQAQYDSAEKVVGSEVLLRWNHPERGVLPPAQFIEVAEQTGLIVSIGNWVIRSACEYQAMLDPVFNPVIAVKLSPRQFRDIDFIDKLKHMLDETQADPAKLKLQITEAMLTDNAERALETLHQLNALGIAISIDDFGTGYSSFAQLHRLPIDELKIDKSFVHNIDTCPENAMIVDSIILMSQHLKLNIIAEGVETNEEFEYLKNRQCQCFQGYLFQRPGTFAEFLQSTIV